MAADKELELIERMLNNFPWLLLMVLSFFCGMFAGIAHAYIEIETQTQKEAVEFGYGELYMIDEEEHFRWLKEVK